MILIQAQPVQQRPRFTLPALGLAVAAISCAAVFFRLAAPTHPIVAAAVRLTIATLILSPIIFRAYQAGAFRRDLVKPIVGAGACYGLHFGAWVSSLTLTSVASSVTLVTATPIILAVVAHFTGRDRAGRSTWIAIFIAILGMTFLGGSDLLLAGSDALLGDALALLGCAAMAAYMLIVRALGDRVDPWAFSGAACAMGAIFLWSTAFIMDVPLVVPTAQAWLFLTLAALIPQLIGHGLITWSLRYITPTLVGLATVAEPVGAAILAFFALDETPHPVGAVGCVLTLTAVVYALRTQSKGHIDPSEPSDD